jgi:hypothetical protein
MLTHSLLLMLRGFTKMAQQLDEYSRTWVCTVPTNLPRVAFVNTFPCLHQTSCIQMPYSDAKLCPLVSLLDASVT